MTEMTRPESILLVDDHPAIRQGLVALLGSCGFQSLAQAATLEEARVILDERPIDLAVLDLSLERGNGLDLVPDLIGHGASVIVYSMFEDARAIRRAIEFGVRGYVTKRDEPADLLSAIERVTAGRQYLSARVAGALANSNAGTESKDLSERERQVLSLMGRGESNIGIAAALGISVRTVETYYARISEKLDISTSVRELRKYAILHHSRD